MGHAGHPHVPYRVEDTDLRGRNIRKGDYLCLLDRQRTVTTRRGNRRGRTRCDARARPEPPRFGSATHTSVSDPISRAVKGAGSCSLSSCDVSPTTRSSAMSRAAPLDTLGREADAGGLQRVAPRPGLGVQLDWQDRGGDGQALGSDTKWCASCSVLQCRPRRTRTARSSNGSATQLDPSISVRTGRLTSSSSLNACMTRCVISSSMRLSRPLSSCRISRVCCPAANGGPCTTPGCLREVVEQAERIQFPTIACSYDATQPSRSFPGRLNKPRTKSDRKPPQERPSCSSALRTQSTARRRLNAASKWSKAGSDGRGTGPSNSQKRQVPCCSSTAARQSHPSAVSYKRYQGDHPS